MDSNRHHVAFNNLWDDFVVEETLTIFVYFLSSFDDAEIAIARKMTLSILKKKSRTRAPHPLCSLPPTSHVVKGATTLTASFSVNR